MGKKLSSAFDQSARQRSCSHYWVIEDVSDATSRGVCKYCGAQRDFNNYCQPSRPEEKTESCQEQPRKRRQSARVKKPEETVVSQVERLFEILSDHLGEDESDQQGRTEEDSQS